MDETSLFRHSGQTTSHGSGGLGQRTLLGDAGASREARRRRPELSDHEEACGRFDELAGDPARRRRHPFGLCGRADPQHDHAPGTHERQAPFGRCRRLRQRLRDRDAGPVQLLLLGPPPHDARVRRRDSLEELALPPLRFQQYDLAIGQRMGERDARRTAAAPDVDDRPVERRDKRQAAKRVVEKNAACGGRIAEGRQARCLENRGEPGVVKRGGRRRTDSAPSPRSSSAPRPRLAAACGRPSARHLSSARAAHARP